MMQMFLKNEVNDYYIFANKLKSEFNKYNANNHGYQVVNSDIIGGYQVSLNEDGSLYVRYSDSDLNKKFGEYKISNNVLSFNVIRTGQGVGNMLYFINSDGTVGSANVEYGVINDGEKIEVIDDFGYKDIVTILSGTFGNGYSCAAGAIFIDINGNIYSDNLK